MGMKRLHLPLIPILIAYGLGLLLGHHPLSISSLSLFLFSLAVFLSGTLFLILKKLKWSSFILLILFFLLGLSSIHLYLRPPLSSFHISRFIGPDPVVVEGTIYRSPQITDRGTQLLVKSQRVILGNNRFPVEGYLLLFLKEREVAIHYGDHLRFLCRLKRPGGFRNLGGFDYEHYLAFQRIYCIGFLPDGRQWVKLGTHPPHPLLFQIERWRDSIRGFLMREAEFPFSSIFQALVLGEQGNIPEEIRELFIISGIAHLLAISGDHLGIVALLSFSLFIWLLKRSEFFLLSFSVKKLASFLTIPSILLYTLIAGGGISVVRSAIMVIVLFLSILFDRDRNLLYSLGLAAFLILLFSPPSLFDVSFQLSFLAVLSIVYLVPRLLREFRQEEIPILSRASWKRLFLKYIKISLVTTAVAILGTAPFVALHFNRFSIIGFLTNLIAIPWVGFLIVPLSLLASLFSFLSPPLASWLITFDIYLTRGLLSWVSWIGSIPYASIYLSTPTGVEILLFYALLFFSVHLRKKTIRWAFIGVCLLFVLDLIYWETKDFFQKDLRVTFLDVGHGDSILVEFPKGKRMLIDGGGLPDERFDIGKKVIAPFLWKKRIRRIDVLTLSHPDPDHLKGLNFVASHFSIGEFWSNGMSDGSESYLQLEKTLKEKRVKSFVLNEESPSIFIQGVEIKALNPPSLRISSPTPRDASYLNNQSLVLRFRFKEVVFLFTGDIEKEAEGRMVRMGYPLQAHILKVPHHGSASSSSPFFLEKVRPRYAILSVGGDRTRLPHPEVIRQYLYIGSILLRTDEQGAITVLTDGEKIEVFLHSEAHFYNGSIRIP